MARPRTRPRDLFGRLIPQRRGRRAELDLQAAIVAYVRMVAPQVLIWAVPNGFLKTKAEAALAKHSGVLAGVPDLTLAWAEGQTAFWEIKTDDGVLSDPQIEILDRLSTQFHRVAIIRSVDEAKEMLQRLGIETREAVS